MAKIFNPLWTSGFLTPAMNTTGLPAWGDRSASGTGIYGNTTGADAGYGEAYVVASEAGQSNAYRVRYPGRSGGSGSDTFEAFSDTDVPLFILAAEEAGRGAHRFASIAGPFGAAKGGTILRAGGTGSLGASSSPDIDRLLEEDRLSFSRDAESRVGEIAGLTSKLELDFFRGDRVYVVTKDGEGKFRKQTLASEHSYEVGEEVFSAYQAWLGYMGFPREEAAAHSPEVERLREFLKEKGVRFETEVPLTPSQALYVMGVLEMVPEGHYKSGYFRELVFRRGAGDIEVYSKGRVTIASWALSGSRRNLMGSLLHGIGHTFADRLAPWSHRDQDALEPDRTIGFDEREKISNVYRHLKNNTDLIYVVNWPGDRAIRGLYLAGDLREFLAEHFFILIVDPEGLLRHIISNESKNLLVFGLYKELFYTLALMVPDSRQGS